uniref:AlNc14C31G2886 protein n=1 Tax=Albugo laibachii Nc14 TaxID=890382 RepID=F0W7T3_9STRA|nr:AlNc14C31G2886 [Albugo laibachii Nc14]|eukprot:CCA17185.1 AlNc14C31G2886 [Albugo laibachii Nc14]
MFRFLKRQNEVAGSNMSILKKLCNQISWTRFIIAIRSYMSKIPVCISLAASYLKVFYFNSLHRPHRLQCLYHLLPHRYREWAAEHAVTPRLLQHCFLSNSPPRLP